MRRHSAGFAAQQDAHYYYDSLSNQLKCTKESQREDFGGDSHLKGSCSPVDGGTSDEGRELAQALTEGLSHG
jgi:hypothetical protein